MRPPGGPVSTLPPGCWQPGLYIPTPTSRRRLELSRGTPASPEEETYRPQHWRVVRKGSEGLTWWYSARGSACQCRSLGFGPWSGRLHVLRSISVHAALTPRPRAKPQLPSLRAAATEARAPRARAPGQEKPEGPSEE